MRFGSVCSGIEAASVAWNPLGWEAAWLSEIEPFPAAVLAHHYPDTPNLGDMTKIAKLVLTGEAEAPDVLCGGTPCQAFSVAGLRESLADERGNLTLKFVELADAIDHVRILRGEPPAIIFWENVPGVLSTRDNAFGCFLAGLAGEDEPLEPPGEKWTNAGCVFGPARAVAWRTLDAQYFGVAQRRRRVFVVASARKGFDPATVLFEWNGVRRDSAPSRDARQVAPTIPARSTGGGGLGTDFDCDCDGGVIAMAHGQGGAEIARERRTTLTCTHEAPIAAYSTKLHNTSSNGAGLDANSPPPAVVVHGTQDPCTSTETAFALGRNSGQENAVAYGIRDISQTITSNYGKQVDSSDTALDPNVVMTPNTQVRRLTPRECERLQGFPDDYTMIPWRKKPAEDCPDGLRHKALGNSWAVPNVRWIGERIDAQLRKGC